MDFCPRFDLVRHPVCVGLVHGQLGPNRGSPWHNLAPLTRLLIQLLFISEQLVDLNPQHRVRGFEALGEKLAVDLPPNFISILGVQVLNAIFRIL